MALSNGREVLVKLKPMAQSKRLKLRIEKGTNAVLVTMPLNCPQSVALKFVRDTEGWIANQLAKQSHKIEFIAGGNIPVFGVKTRLEIAPLRTKMVLVRDTSPPPPPSASLPPPPLRDGGVKLGQTLIIPSKPENFAEKTKSALKKLALDAANTHLKILEPKIEKRFSKIRITDTKSRWGSCSHDGVISLCWRLVLAPPDVFHYVIAHEIAHLKEMNHSVKFWRECERLMPNFKTHRAWLKKNGTMLHNIG